MNPHDAEPFSSEFVLLQTLMQETVSFSHRLKVVAESIHLDAGISAGQWGVMRDLTRLGPLTVPQLARMRPVSRQHMQAVVNGLLEGGHVRLAANPAHKRSRLVALTTKGEKTYRSMGRREEELLTGFELPVSGQQLEQARAVLQSLRRAFESEAWSRRIGAMSSAKPAQGDLG